MMDWPNPNLFPQYYDPFATAERHPELPTGANSTDINGDMINGPGINFPIETLLFDAYEGMTPIIMTEEMQEVFDGCPDWLIACENLEILLPGFDRTVEMRGRWPTLEVPIEARTISVPREERKRVITRENSQVSVPSPTDTLVYGKGNVTTEVEP